MALERSVIRWLYGRPLETLLATWGISLMLIQAVRTIFGAQNVQVENPSFMSGGIQVLSNVVLPWNRIMIIVFAAAVLVGMWVLLTRTRLGLLHPRRDAEPRRWRRASACRRRASTPGPSASARASPGSPAARSRSSATSAPTSARATSSTRSWWWCSAASASSPARSTPRSTLGFANKLLESWSGAVLAKIAVLVFIIVFIQRRPQGLFALKGRAVEA